MPLAYTLAEKARGINFPNETEAAYKRIWDQFCVFYVSPSFIFLQRISAPCYAASFFVRVRFHWETEEKKALLDMFHVISMYIHWQCLIPSKHKQLLATAREVTRHLERRKTIIP